MAKIERRREGGKVNFMTLVVFPHQFLSEASRSHFVAACIMLRYVSSTVCKVSSTFHHVFDTFTFTTFIAKTFFFRFFSRSKTKSFFYIFVRIF